MKPHNILPDRSINIAWPEGVCQSRKLSGAAPTKAQRKNITGASATRSQM
jgi:hypothetical protein